MRSSHSARYFKPLFNFIAIFCAVALCCGLLPSAAFAARTSLSLIPEGEQGAARVISGAEGGGPVAFSHCAADGDPSVDAGGAASTFEDVSDNDQVRISEDVPLVPTGRGYVEVEFDELAEGESENALQAATAISFEERVASSADATKKYRVYFDANGGDWAPQFSSSNSAAYGEAMPDITRYLASYGSAPKREKYVFMGFYDGSDWRTATKYYDKDFKSCGLTYPYTADGLTLYAGWAPVLSYKVPTSVSIAVGTIAELGAPTVAPGKVVNESPWPIKCSAITWNAEELRVGDEDILAAEAQVSGLLAKSVKMNASTLGQMFSPLSGVYLKMTMDGETAAVTPKNTQSASFMVSANAEADVSYTLSLAQGTSVIGTEMVSRTTLVTPFEAVLQNPDGTSAVEATKSAILFDAGQGTGGQTSRILATAGVAVPELTNRTAPVFEGWTFKGWFDSPDWQNAKMYYDENGQRALDAEGDIVVWDKERDTVLHAGWDIKGCKVLFDAKGDGAVVPAGSDQATLLASVPYGSSIGSLPGYGGGLPEPEWVVDGIPYEFEGWFDSEGHGPYTGAEKVYDYAGTLVLTARWSGVPVTVTWDAQGGSSVEPWIAFPSGSALSKRGNLPTTERAGYIFSGWWSASSSGIQVSTSTVVPDAITYYAHWTPKEITLSWNVDGAITQSPAVNYSEDLTVIVPEGLSGSALNSVKGEGWSFRGWAAPDGAILDLAARNPLPTENTTYTAKWNAYVTFDAGEGSFVGTNPSGYYAVGETLPAPALQARPGYRFTGWFTVSDVKLENNTTVSGPVIYTPRFDDERVTITFDANNGVFPSGNVTMPIKGASGTSLALPEEPTKEGFVFQGWSTGSSLLTSPLIFPDMDCTYTAVWQGKTVNITWDISSNGGKWEGGSHDGQSISLTTSQIYGENGNKVVLPSDGEAIRDEYAFQGWFTESSGGNPVTAESTLPAGAAGENPVNVTYYAQFVERPCRVTFDLAGGEWNLSSIPTLTVRFNNPMPEIKIGDTLADVPTRLGYDFAGFYSGDTQYYSGHLVSARPWNMRKDVTLKAKWTPWEFNVSFNLNNGYGTAPLTQHVTWEQSVSLVGDPQHLGGPFVGWSLYPNAHRAFDVPINPKNPSSYIPEYYVVRADITSITMPEIYELSKKINQILPSWNVSFPAGGGNITFYAVYQQVMYPKDSVEEVGDGFYLNITTADANGANIPIDYVGFYSIDDIKTAANDIAEKGTNSEYHALFNRIMQNDVQFTTTWENVSTWCHPNRVSSPGSYLGSYYSYGVRLIGLNQDYVNAARTEFAGMTFQFAGETLREAYRVNKTNVNLGGWEKSELRARMNSGASEFRVAMQSGDDNARSSIWDRAPQSLKDNIKTVYKLTHNAGGLENNVATAVSATPDQFFLTSYWEMVSSGNAFTAYPWITRETVNGGQYQFYKSHPVNGSLATNSCLIKKLWEIKPSYLERDGTKHYRTEGYLNPWWMRTVSPSRNVDCLEVTDAGYPSEITADTDQPGGIVPCFCL